LTKFDRSTLLALTDIPWFTNIETDEADASCPSGRALARVDGVAAASRMARSLDWENIGYASQRQLRAWLWDHHPDEITSWNKIADKVRPRIVAIADPVAAALEARVPELHGLQGRLRWHLIHTVIEASYAHRRPPRFYADLHEIYRQGHLPCGWDGAFPDGTLLYR